MYDNDRGLPSAASIASPYLANSLQFWDPLPQICTHRSGMDEDKINQAAATCVAHAMGTKAPFSRVSEYIASLKADASWSDAELVEVQTRVIRQLMTLLNMKGESPKGEAD